MTADTNPFQRHGMAHLSVSTCNLFAAAPAAFVLQKVLKVQTSVGVRAHSGTAVEAGIAHGLETGAPDAECIAVAQRRFGELTALSADPRRETEAASLPGFVAQGLTELRPYGKPSRTQGRIEYWFESLPVPFVGFFDFAWDDHGLVVDLKTSHKLASQISTGHARQVALYKQALGGDNFEGRVSYVTPKKAATYRLENAREHLAALEIIGNRIERFLSVSDDPDALAAIVAPDVESFYFADPITRAATFKIWGL